MLPWLLAAGLALTALVMAVRAERWRWEAERQRVEAAEYRRRWWDEVLACKLAKRG